MKIWSTFYKLRSHEIPSTTCANDSRRRGKKEQERGGTFVGPRRRVRAVDAIRAKRRSSRKAPLISRDRYGRRRRLIAPRAISRDGIMAADRMICAFGASDVHKQRYATRGCVATSDAGFLPPARETRRRRRVRANRAP